MDPDEDSIFDKVINKVGGSMRKRYKNALEDAAFVGAASALGAFAAGPVGIPVGAAIGGFVQYNRRKGNFSKLSSKFFPKKKFYK